jgi:hypothetical protein
MVQNRRGNYDVILPFATGELTDIQLMKIEAGWRHSADALPRTFQHWLAQVNQGDF